MLTSKLSEIIRSGRVLKVAWLKPGLNTFAARSMRNMRRRGVNPFLSAINSESSPTYYTHHNATPDIVVRGLGWPESICAGKLCGIWFATPPFPNAPERKRSFSYRRCTHIPDSRKSTIDVSRVESRAGFWVIFGWLGYEWQWIELWIYLWQ